MNHECKRGPDRQCVNLPRPVLGSGTHSVQFYEEDSFLLDSLTKLIGTAFVAGKTAVVVITAAHRDGLEKRLTARGFDLEVTGQTRANTVPSTPPKPSPASWSMATRHRTVQRLREILSLLFRSVRHQRQSPRLVLFGEMVALLWSRGNFDAALRLEQTLERSCAHLLLPPALRLSDEGLRSRGSIARHSSTSAPNTPTSSPQKITQLSRREDDRLRHVSLLQQRAQAAETEAAGRLRAEEALRHSEKLAATGRLAATIAHEINNPLEAISNAIYLARSSPPSDVAEYLKIADEELARVAQITRQTLGFYRETASPGIVKISTLLDELLSLFSRKLQAKNLTIRKQYRGELEVWGLEGELRQVFANQIANAIYAMPQPTARLTIRIRRSKSWSNGQRPGTAVSLVDTGSGISPEALSKIFDPFFTTKQDVGNGLGLWITHGIVTSHGGSIRVRSNTRPDASGTIFTTFLPSHERQHPRRPFNPSPHHCGGGGCTGTVGGGGTGLS